MNNSAWVFSVSTKTRLLVQTAPKRRSEIKIGKSSKKLIFEQSDGWIAWPAEHQWDGNKRELAASAGGSRPRAGRPVVRRDSSKTMEGCIRLKCNRTGENRASFDGRWTAVEQMSEVKRHRWERCFNLLTQSITRRRKVRPPWTTWHAKFNDLAWLQLTFRARYFCWEGIDQIIQSW